MISLILSVVGIIRGIPKALCSLNYITIDSAIEHIKQIGQGTPLAKINIKNAFRLLQVHPVNSHLLATRWDRCIFIDTCLPLGLRSAPKLFNVLADLLSWILEHKQAKPVLRYLDTFLIMDPPQSPVCSCNLLVIKDICSMLGIPLALKK